MKIERWGTGFSISDEFFKWQRFSHLTYYKALPDWHMPTLSALQIALFEPPFFPGRGCMVYCEG